MESAHVVVRGMLLFLVAFCVLGCAEEGPPMGTVQGTVTIGGKPPEEPIRVQFINSIIGQGAAGVTQEDGTYELDQPLRVDDYTVYFERIVDYSQGPVSSSQEVLTSVPKEYRTEQTSPLKETVQEGENTIALEIP